ncbi:MAG: autotransporter domain-containing protein [Deltaproteobacteria bacterium]|nr:autotransporter domain-containing protein [Deltaproteobacteria bacterium]
MKRIGMNFRAGSPLFGLLLLTASPMFAWQEPSPGNFVSEAPPVVNPQLIATGGSTVDVLSGHSVDGGVDGIDLMTAGYTVTNRGSIGSSQNGVFYQQGGTLKNFGTISTGIGGVLSSSGSFDLLNLGDISGSVYGVQATAPDGNITVENLGKIKGTGGVGLEAMAPNGSVEINYGTFTGGQIGAQVIADQDVRINSASFTGDSSFGLEAISLNGNVDITGYGRFIGGDTGALAIGDRDVRILTAGASGGTFGLEAISLGGHVSIVTSFLSEVTGGVSGIRAVAADGIDIDNIYAITGNSGSGIEATALNGNIEIANLMAGITGGASGVEANTTSGNISIWNNSRGTITGIGGSGIEATASNGNIVIENQGRIIGGETGVDAVTADGNIDITNIFHLGILNRIAGTSLYGIRAVSGNGNIIVTNGESLGIPRESLTIEGHHYGVHATASSGSIQLQNAGNIAAHDTAAGAGIHADSVGDLWLHNSGTITGFRGIESSAGGSATFYNYGSIVAGGTPAEAVYHVGTATLENWGTIRGDVVLPGAFPHDVVLHSGSTLSGDLAGGALTDSLTLDGGGALISRVTGFDSLTKTGAGLWSLTDDVNLGASSGTVNIEEGTLSVNGNLTAWQLSVLSGATLQGTGILSGRSSNMGTVAPGNSIGSMNIIGNYVQGATGALAIEVDGTGAHDVLAVTGTASLAGRLDIYPLGFIPGRSTFGGILTASDGVSGLFDEAVLVSGSSVLSIVPVYNGYSVDLVFNRNYSGVAKGRQRRTVAQVIDGITSLASVSADLQSIQSRLDMSSVSDINLALGEMNPAIYDSLKEASFIQGRFFADASLARLDTLRGEASFGKAQAEPNPSPHAVSPEWNREPFKQANLFFQGGGEFYDRSGTFERVGYSLSGGGFVGGIDSALSPWLTGGVVAGYAKSALDFDDHGGSEADVGSVYVGGYAGFEHMQWFADLSLGYVFNSYEMHRRMLSTVFRTTADSSFDGGEFLTKFHMGRRFKVGGFGLTPAVKLEYANLERDGFVENGAGGLNLAVKAHTDESLQSSLGATLDYRMELGNWVVTPMIRAFWVHEMLDDNLDYASTLNGIPGSPFVTTAADAETDAAKLGAGIKFSLGKNLTAYVAYDAVLVSGYDWQEIRGGLRFAF